jgi:hypothetical protein
MIRLLIRQEKEATLWYRVFFQHVPSENWLHQGNLYLFFDFLFPRSGNLRTSLLRRPICLPFPNQPLVRYTPVEAVKALVRTEVECKLVRSI